MRAYPGVPDVIIDGEFLEVDPPRKLVQTWRMLMDPTMQAEGFTRLTHEIEPIDGGVTKLTVIHELEGAPTLASMVAGESESQRRRRRLGVGALRPQDASWSRAPRWRRAEHVAERVLEAIRAVGAPERRRGGARSSPAPRASSRP